MINELKSKHKKILDNYDNTKSNHLERLGSKMLKNEEMFRKLKEKKLDPNFLNKF